MNTKFVFRISGAFLRPGKPKYRPRVYRSVSVGRAPSNVNSAAITASLFYLPQCSTAVLTLFNPLMLQLGGVFYPPPEALFILLLGNRFEL